jgi:acetoin:2,6-dichlorophenolindophenol oxidoreductase subunit beta
MTQMSFWEALRDGYRVAMAKDPSVVLMGVGITEPQAVFGTIDGLEQEFGSDRFIEGPLAEQMLTGAALGASLMGLRPVLMHRRIDWLPLTMDQIVSSWAKWEFAFGGRQRASCVVRGIVGRGFGNGPAHTQSLHGFCANVPGVNVVVPATPADAKALTLASIFADSPVIFIDHRSQHNLVGDVPEGDVRVPLGKADTLRLGRDITVVAVGPMVQEALAAAAALERQDISLEVINLRTIRPIDFECVFASVNRTGRLIVADADWPHFGVASAIVSAVTQRLFTKLRHAPVAITWPDHPVLASYGLEATYYPGAKEIQSAACVQMGMREHAPSIAHSREQTSGVAVGPF